MNRDDAKQNASNDSEVILLRGNYTRIQYRRTFFRGEEYRKSDAVSAGIQDVDTHAPYWNQVRMCVQINSNPSALRVFGAGTQHGFKENGCFKSAGIQKKRVLEYSIKKC